MDKTVTLVGGPADGKVFAVAEGVGVLNINCVKNAPVKPMGDDWNLFANIVGWDDYGPIFDHSHLFENARYRIQGDEGIYEPPQT